MVPGKKCKTKVSIHLVIQVVVLRLVIACLAIVVHEAFCLAGLCSDAEPPLPTTPWLSFTVAINYLFILRKQQILLFC